MWTNIIFQDCLDIKPTGVGDAQVYAVLNDANYNFMLMALDFSGLSAKAITI